MRRASGVLSGGPPTGGLPARPSGRGPHAGAGRRLRLGVLGACLGLGVHAGDWPQWRGPSLDGSAAPASLPAAWTQTDSVRWSVPMPGPGSSTPVVWGRRVFLTSVRSADRKLLAVCLDTRSGEVLWSRVAGEDRPASNNTMASPSAVTDGARVCFTFGTGLLLCCRADNGAPVWQRDLEQEYGHNALMFGYSSSPLLHDGVLYVQALRNRRADAYLRPPPAGTDPAQPTPAYAVAIELATGATRWRRERPTEARAEAQEAYTTPALLNRNGRNEILIYGADRLTAWDAEDGRETWSWEGYNPDRIDHWRVVASPVVGPELVYVVGPKYSTLFALRPPARDGEPAAVVWRHEALIPDASTPLFYQGRLYVVQDNRRILVCLDPSTGAVLWQGDLGGGGVVRASLTGADGRLFALLESGEAVVVRAGGDAFQILHRVKMGRGPARSTISVGDDALFIRTADRLFCVGR